MVTELKCLINGSYVECMCPCDSLNALLYLQELKDKDVLLRQQRELLQVAHEQKVSEGLCVKHTGWIT